MGNSQSDASRRAEDRTFDGEMYYVSCDEDYDEYPDYELEDTVPREEAGGGPTSVTGTVRTVGDEGETGADTEPKDLVLGLCGLEPGAGEWEEVPPEPPIRESRLTAEEKAKFHEHLDIIFGEEALRGKRLVFHPNDVMEVMKKVIPYLESESMLIEDVPFDVTVVGDIHGQLHDLHRIFMEDAKDGKSGWERMKYVFLGNYVDRGRQSLETVMALFCIKMLYPDRIFLLRGNHEFVIAHCQDPGNGQQFGGFPLEIKERYEDMETAKVLYGCVNVAFCYLSVAAVVGNKFLCVHAGVSAVGMTRKLIRRIPKPYISSNDDYAAHAMMWADPAIGLRGTTFNTDRGTSTFFSVETMAYGLYNMDCIGLFRGHTMLANGYELVGELCVSLYSASGQNGNKGSIAHVLPTGAVVVKILEVDHARVAWDADLLRLEDKAAAAMGATDGDVDVEKINVKDLEQPTGRTRNI